MYVCMYVQRTKSPHRINQENESVNRELVEKILTHASIN